MSITTPKRAAEEPTEIDLATYFERTKEGYSAFAERVLSNKGDVHNYASGRRPCSLKMALRIEDATGGLVTPRMMRRTHEKWLAEHSKTEGPPKPKRRSREAHAPP